jgi:hypothetical protein
MVVRAVRRPSKWVRGWIGSSLERARPKATSRYSCTGTCCACLAPHWIGLPAGAGQHFLLDTGTLCVLGYYREIPAVKIWNGPLVG